MAPSLPSRKGGEGPKVTVGDPDGRRLRRALSYMVDCRIDGATAFTWLGNGKGLEHACSRALTALDLTIRSITAATGAAFSPIPTNRIELEVAPYDWRTHSLQWTVMGPFAKSLRGVTRSRIGRDRTARMAATRVERALAQADILTADSSISTSMTGPERDGSITVRISGLNLRKVVPDSAMDIGLAETAVDVPGADDALAIAMAHAALRKAESQRGSTTKAALRRSASATMRAAITSGAASSWPDERKGADALIALIKSAQPAIQGASP